MATRQRYAQRYLAYHRGYEKRAFKELKKVFNQWGRSIPWNELTIENYKAQVQNSLSTDLMYGAYYNIWYGIGVVHGARVGKDINLQLKAFSLDIFKTAFEWAIGLFLRKWGVRRIRLVEETYFEEIEDLLATRLEKEQDMRAVAKEVEKIVNKPTFYNWQAQRIARTESTGASNYGATMAGKSTGYVMVKEWISTADKRTRGNPDGKYPDTTYDHFEMDNILVGAEEKFMFNKDTATQDELSYPGDPEGQAANTINCRCTVAIIPKRDENGRLIPTE